MDAGRNTGADPEQIFSALFKKGHCAASRRPGGKCPKSKVQGPRSLKLKTCMQIESFEDIESWKKAREMTRLVYHHSKRGELARDFGLRDQIRRASTSIMSNIAEGIERGGD